MHDGRELFVPMATTEGFTGMSWVFSGIAVDDETLYSM